MMVLFDLVRPVWLKIFGLYAVRGNVLCHAGRGARALVTKEVPVKAVVGVASALEIASRYHPKAAAANEQVLYGNTSRDKTNAISLRLLWMIFSMRTTRQSKSSVRP